MKQTSLVFYGRETKGKIKVTVTKRISMSYITSKEYIESGDQQLVENNKITLSTYSDINKIFPLASNPNSDLDIILIDIEQFYNHEDINFFDIIQTLETLIGFNKTKILLVVVCGVQTDPVLIKEVLSTNLGIYPRGNEFTLDEKQKAAEALWRGEKYVPIKIRDLTKTKKKASVANNPNIIRLTPRQQQVLSLITSRGASNKSIARILKISESTVKLHITAILKKYSLRNRTQLALFCQKEESKKIKE